MRSHHAQISRSLQTKYRSAQGKSGIICDRLIIRRRFIATIEHFQLTPQEDIKRTTRRLSIILNKVMFYHVFSTQVARPMKSHDTRYMWRMQTFHKNLVKILPDKCPHKMHWSLRGKVIFSWMIFAEFSDKQIWNQNSIGWPLVLQVNILITKLPITGKRYRLFQLTLIQASGILKIHLIHWLQWSSLFRENSNVFQKIKQNTRNILNEQTISNLC